MPYFYDGDGDVTLKTKLEKGLNMVVSSVLAKHVEHEHSKVFMKYCYEFEAKLSMSND
jgi:hypothetical protein